MKTLKEYADFLYKNGYKENFAPYTFLDGNLEIVEFIKNGYHINLFVEETKEFSEYLSSLDLETEYQVEYENYNVKSAFIESPICNVSNFLDGSTNGIELVSEPNAYNKHTLDLFELCINFQKTNLLEHELFIMSQRLKHLAWAKDNLIPILEKYNFYVVYDSFFDTKQERNSSNIRIDFKHPNRAYFVIEVDCLTGKPIIWVDINSTNGVIDLTDKIYGKNQDDIFNILLEEVWKKNEHKFGYIYNNDPHETVDTYNNVLNLMDCLHYNEKRKDINFDVIPQRYEKWVLDYNEM
jgi:hypothetical protein